jgi:hypothetical protein
MPQKNDVIVPVLNPIRLQRTACALEEKSEKSRKAGRKS